MASLGLLALMCKSMRILLPVLTIEFDDVHLGKGFIQAVDVHVYPVGIGARDVEGFDAAGLAEPVLGYAAVEGVGL